MKRHMRDLVRDTVPACELSAGKGSWDNEDS